MSSDYISFPCIQVSQPIGTFYICSMSAEDVHEISVADVHRIEQRDVEVFLGIQRPLSKLRVAEIKQYILTVDASFPTSVILAISSDDAEYDENKGMMRIKREQKVARIIDGQHRIAGFEEYGDDKFDLNVTIFIDMDLEDQAYLFATINLEQTKVNKSIAYNLYEFATSRSPQKTCHNIAKLLNSKVKSPFYGQIKILGRASGQPRETLSQATFVDRLIPYISSDPMYDRDLLKRGKTPARVKLGEERTKHLIFRNMFLEERDAEIARVVWNYFGAVAARWPEAWYAKEQGIILNRTMGFGALMRFLPHAYLGVAKPREVPPASKFKALFERVQLTDGQFTSENFRPGASGEVAFFKQLQRETEVS